RGRSEIKRRWRKGEEMRRREIDRESERSMRERERERSQEREGERERGERERERERTCASASRAPNEASSAFTSSSFFSCNWDEYERQRMRDREKNER